jgi:thioredoxin-like negative regulator of GroEL
MRFLIGFCENFKSDFRKYASIAERSIRMDRKKELLDQLPDDATRKMMEPLIDDIVFLEETLYALKRLPFIRVSDKDSNRQKATPAAKQYKELLQQYNNSLKVLRSAMNKTDGEEESELRKWFNRRAG